MVHVVCVVNQGRVVVYFVDLEYREVGGEGVWEAVRVRDTVYAAVPDGVPVIGYGVDIQGVEDGGAGWLRRVGE